jgi:hypothetical protein
MRIAPAASMKITELLGQILRIPAVEAKTA